MSGVGSKKRRHCVKSSYVKFFAITSRESPSHLSIHCLAHHCHVKCTSFQINEETCSVRKVFLEKKIREAINYTEHAKKNKKNITAMDVVYTMKHQGCTLYGFGGFKCSFRTMLRIMAL
uniref:Histone H4 n=1 Tax=Astyanax mexicanus TaxID=7994 RepID=A0A3B1JYI3_ASTMX